MQILVTDRASYSISKREYLDNGFLKVPGRVARTGIQQYLASELGIKDGDPNRVVNVYRPPQEVFNPSSLSTYKGTDVTDDHPAEMVNSANFRKLSVGHVDGEAYQDGDFVVAPLIIKDKDAIKKIEDGKAQLSAGYYAEYKKEDGITPDGQSYEFIQTDIKINHVALVDRARAGAQARIFDRQRGGSMPTVTIDGLSIELQDAASATLVQQKINSMQSTLDAYKKDMEEKDEEMEKEKAAKDMAEEEKKDMEKAKDAAIAELQVYVSKEALDSAKLIAGSDFTCDSKDVMTIKRAALSKVRTSIDWADKSDAYVEAAYDMEKEKAEDMEEEKKDEDKEAKDSYRNLANDMSSAHNQQPKPDAFTTYRNGFNDAWKKTVNQEK